jgi:hypothetical protein
VTTHSAFARASLGAALLLALSAATMASCTSPVAPKPRTFVLDTVNGWPVPGDMPLSNGPLHFSGGTLTFSGTTLDMTVHAQGVADSAVYILRGPYTTRGPWLLMRRNGAALPDTVGLDRGTSIDIMLGLTFPQSATTTGDSAVFLTTWAADFVFRR